jgi:hypothetical protein
MVNYSLDARHSLPLRRRISPPRNLDFPYPLLVHIADPSFSDCYVHDMMRIPYMRENDRWRPRCFFFSLLLTAKSCMLGPAGWHLCAMTPSWWPRHCGLWAWAYAQAFRFSHHKAQSHYRSLLGIHGHRGIRYQVCESKNAWQRTGGRLGTLHGAGFWKQKLKPTGKRKLESQIDRQWPVGCLLRLDGLRQSADSHA